MPMITGQRGALAGWGGYSPIHGATGGSIVESTAGPDQEKIAQIQADASKFPYQLRDQHFKALFPMLQQGFGAMGGGPFTAGGASGPGPAISAGPVWNPQQIQQRVNASRAQTDAATASQQKQAGEAAAGRGFSAMSPLTMALQGQVAGQGMATNAANENQIRWDAAGGNAKQTLEGQKAREGQFAARQDEDIRRRQPWFQSQNALLAALGGMI